MRLMRNKLGFILILFSLLLSCTSDEKRYKIGVSQCSEDVWRDKQNAELRLGTYFHDDVELCFAVAYDSDERQVQQIDSLVRLGIDLLIVAPNQVATISPAIDRAYDKGIPVIVFERKTNSQKYTAYIGADNYEMGRVMGEYVASRLKGKGRVMEVMGLKGSSPAIERHKGFTHAMEQWPDIQVVATLQGDWTEQSAYDAVQSFDGDLTTVDFVFGQNDRMAMGARRAIMEQAGSRGHAPLYCGIDGLAGETGGIRLVRDSILDATYIYPTRGDRILSLAIDILEGKPYEKEERLMSALVTHDNANVLLMQNEEIVRRSGYLDDLHAQASTYLRQLSAQRTISWLATILVFLLLLLMAGIWLYFRQRARIHRERTQMEREQLDFYTQVSHELRTPLTLIEGPLAQLAEASELQTASPQTASLFDIVCRNTHHLTEIINKMLAPEGTTGTNGAAETIEATGATETIEATRTSEISEDSETNGASILIVDDNADIRTYLRTILQRRFQLFEAENGQKGLEVAQQQVPDLIISDVMMPVMNGLQFCQQVKDGFVTSHIPVILLTARALSRHQVEGFRSGADAYITKPFDPELLLTRIDNLLRNRRLLKNLWEARVSEETRKDEDIPHVESRLVPPSPQTSEPPTTPQPDSLANEVEAPFITRFKTIVEQSMGDSELSVEIIGTEMGLSRVQLYRKVKALTGTTPVDLLRKARLVKSRQLLTQTDLSVSEVAYKVGFTSPSYFTKCFKDEYGIVPGDVR